MTVGEKLKIWGAPGTGKTTYLLDIVDGEMKEGRLPWEIIYTSFTRASCNEAITRALTRFDNYTRKDFPYFRTEHAICFKLLGLKKEQVFSHKRLLEFGKRYAYEFSTSDNGLAIEARFQDFLLQTPADYFEFFADFMDNKMLGFAEAFKQFELANPVAPPFNKDDLSLYLERRAKYKEENRLWSFSDMIWGTLQRGLFPESAKVLVVDEAQDCSRLLWALITAWAQKAESYYIAGDPLQTLYYWSGSDPDLFFQFEGEEEVLKQSYRLTPQVKDYAERIIAPTGLRFPTFQPSTRPGEVNRASFYSIDWQNITDAFLLVRTRWLISQVVDYFISSGVPFAAERGRQSPLVTGKGLAFLTLVKLADGERVSDSELKNLVKYTKAPYLQRGAKTGVRNLSEGVWQKWELLEMGFAKVFMDALYGDLSAILCQNVEDWEKVYLRRVYRKLGRKAFDRASNLVVTTIHGSKGREKANVFVMPDMTQTVWDAYIQNRVPETLLYYVAVTRAANNLTLLLPQRDYSFPLPRLPEVMCR